MTTPRTDSGDRNPPVATPVELTLAEERLVVSTLRVPARRVRLEKFVITETRSITVEVSREEVRLVDVDVDGDGDGDANGDPTDAGGRPGDADRWLVLHAERVVVSKEVVPVERVQLRVTAVTEHRDVTQDVRRERIAVDGP